MQRPFSRNDRSRRRICARSSGSTGERFGKYCLCAVLLFCVLQWTGCADTQTAQPEQSQTAAQSQEIDRTTQAETTEAPEKPFPIPDGLPPVDVDLSGMSQTMMYAQVYEMIYNPESYHGKQVRIRGPFQSFADEKTGETRCVCLIKDATACCTQGIEFEPESGQDDLPPQDSEVLVSGTFDSYIRDMYLICVLRDAVLEAHE